MWKDKNLKRWMRILAGLVLMSFGASYLALGFPMLLVGFPLLLIGLGATGEAGFRLWQSWKNRPDPYDLRLLNETSPYRGESRDAPAEEPSREAEADDLVICHRCQVSMPSHYSICPQCGVPLGH